MVVCVANEVQDGLGAINVTGIDFNADALRRIARAASGTFGACEIWIRELPDVATDDVVITMSAADRIVGGVYVLDFCDVVNPIKGFRSISGSSGTSVSLPMIGELGDLVIDSLDIDSTGHSAAPGADQTEQWDIEPAASSTTGVSSVQLGGYENGIEDYRATMSYSWTTAGPFAYIAACFRAAEVDRYRRARRTVDLCRQDGQARKLYSIGAFA